MLIMSNKIDVNQNKIPTLERVRYWRSFNFCKSCFLLFLAVAEIQRKIQKKAVTPKKIAFSRKFRRSTRGISTTKFGKLLRRDNFVEPLPISRSRQLRGRPRLLGFLAMASAKCTHNNTNRQPHCLTFIIIIYCKGIGKDEVRYYSPPRPWQHRRRCCRF